MPNKRSAEEIVRERWPQAWADYHDWSIWSLPWNTIDNVAESRWLGYGITERGAWADAAARIKASEKATVAKAMRESGDEL